MRRVLLIDSDYRGHRIEVIAQHVDGAWDAEIRVRRTFTEDKPHVERVTCRKPPAQVAEERAAVYARRWVDRQSAHFAGRAMTLTFEGMSCRTTFGKIVRCTRMPLVRISSAFS